jgi:hypothetical protein
VADSLPQLVDEVRRYLDDPERDGHGRREAAARECGPMDGRSGRRIGGYLLEAMAATPADGAVAPQPRPERAPAGTATGSAI